MSGHPRPRPSFIPDWTQNPVSMGLDGYRELLRVPALSFGRFIAKPGYNDRQDPHTDDEIYFITRGQADLIVDGETYPMRAGSAAYVPAGVPHRFTRVEKEVDVVVFFAPLPQAPSDQETPSTDQARHDDFVDKRHEPVALADLKPPDTAATRNALRIAERYASPSLLNHARRSWLWARADALIRGVRHDAELLYVAAMLHDLGLERTFDNVELPFEEASGHLAWTFAIAAGWNEHRASRAFEVIVSHMSDEVDVDDDPEGHLLERATSLDISGARLTDWPSELRREVLTAVPRLSLAKDFTRCFAEQAERKPTSAAAAAIGSGIATRMRRNSLETEGR